MNRRELITTGLCLIAAPAIVRAEWIMPVKVIKPAYEPFWIDSGCVQFYPYDVRLKQDGVWAPIPLTSGKAGYWRYNEGSEKWFVELPGLRVERRIDPNNGVEHVSWIKQA